LTAPLRSLIDFLCIDEDLVQAAAVTSAWLSSGPGHSELAAWIRSLAESEKNNLLVMAALESGEHWKSQLLHRFYQENQPLAPPAIASQPRTVGDLLSAAEIIANERAQKLAAERAIEIARRKAEEEANRARYLDQLAKREEASWDQVNELIQKKQPRTYGQAIRLLIDLRDLAARQRLEATFKAKIERLRETHRAKTRFLDRLTEAAL